jgi:hypothetical protein
MTIKLLQFKLWVSWRGFMFWWLGHPSRHRSFAWAPYIPKGEK